jgi:hypothetical protein
VVCTITGETIPCHPTSFAIFSSGRARLKTICDDLGW